MYHQKDEIDQFRKRIFDHLGAWPGYKVCTRIMTRFPTLEVYLAGGAVRDVILGRDVQSKDFDIFLGGDAVEVALEVWGTSGSMELGPFGSPRWFPSPAQSQYCDLIPISRFINGLWRCEDIIDVLNQFDFTGNAVAFDLRSGRFFDPQNGRRDLHRRVLRSVRFDY